MTDPTPATKPDPRTFAYEEITVRFLVRVDDDSARGQHICDAGGSGATLEAILPY